MGAALGSESAGLGADCDLSSGLTSGQDCRSQPNGHVNDCDEVKRLTKLGLPLASTLRTTARGGSSVDGALISRSCATDLLRPQGLDYRLRLAELIDLGQVEIGLPVL